MLFEPALDLERPRGTCSMFLVIRSIELFRFDCCLESGDLLVPLGAKQDGDRGPGAIFIVRFDRTFLDLPVLRREDVDTVPAGPSCRSRPASAGTGSP